MPHSIYMPSLRKGIRVKKKKRKRREEKKKDLEGNRQYEQE